MSERLARARPVVHAWSPPLEREHNRATRKTIAAHKPPFDRRLLVHPNMVVPRMEPSRRNGRQRIADRGHAPGHAP